MIAVLLIFAVMWVMTYMAGIVAMELMRRLYGRSGSPVFAAVTDWIGTCIAGVVVLCVYAEFYSLFAGVGAASLLLALGACAAGFCCVIRTKSRRRVCRDGHSKVHDKAGDRTHSLCMCSITRVFAAILIFALFSVGTARGYMHFDSDLYHAQSIHWIEAYGVVKGLANLHNRLGYNSALFPLSALFSFHWLPGADGQSFHVVNGFLASLLCMECLKVFRMFCSASSAAARTCLPDAGQDGDDSPAVFAAAGAEFVCVMGLYYLFSAFDEIVAPSSDCIMVLLTFYIVIRYLCCLSRMRGMPDFGTDTCAKAVQHETDEDGGTFELALLSLLCVFNVSVKLSAAGLVLLAVLPAWNLLKKKDFANTALFLCAGMVIIAPYLIRNVILSGYLVYPFPSVDLFACDWKVPYGAALSDAREIRAWGKGLMDVAMAEAPMKIWWSSWWWSLAKVDKALLVVSVSCFLPALLAGAANRSCAETSVLLSLGAAFLFWLRSAPLIRYGCVFVYCLSAYEAALLCVWLRKKVGIPARPAKTAFFVFLVLFMTYKTVVTGQEQLRMDLRPYLLRQQDYGQYEVQGYTIDNIVIMCPTEGNQCGYSAFPSSPTDRSGYIELRGDRLEDGFRARQGEDK